MDILHFTKKSPRFLHQGSTVGAAKLDANPPEKSLSQCGLHVAGNESDCPLKMAVSRLTCETCHNWIQLIYSLRHETRRCNDPHRGTVVGPTINSSNGVAAMSTKFSGHGKLHKPPAVCKTPPASRVDPATPHQEQTFQGYASWYDTDVSDWVAITGALTMIPIGNGVSWRGRTPRAEIELELLMTWLKPLARHRYDLTRFQNEIPLETVTIYENDDRNFAPFDSGLLLFPQEAPSIAIQARVNY